MAKVFAKILVYMVVISVAMMLIVNVIIATRLVSTIATAMIAICAMLRSMTQAAVCE
jgi:hypothetical protein